MSEYFWDEQINYLMRTRYLYFNDDYLEFLVEKVWKITVPVKIIDFGCGLGYLGLKLLPLLPKGSTYTGVDRGEKLLENAEILFSKLPYETNFIKADITNMEIEKDQYDLAICQALLLHLENPKAQIKRMMQSIKVGGKVICIEPNWLSVSANTYLSEMSENNQKSIGILQKLFDLDYKRTGKDGNIGPKVPIYMNELGLKNIQSRISDCVRYLHPKLKQDEYVKMAEALGQEGYGRKIDDEAFIKRLMERGLTVDEAKDELDIEKEMNRIYRENKELNLVFASTMMITFGKK